MDIRKDRDCLVMEARYHIITDIECKILHYGTEIGVAAPGEDSFIMLKKGKHLLTYVSIENEQDSYKDVFEVPENDIEDYIEVKLAPYREARLEKEAEQRRQEEMKRMEEEAKQKAEEKRRQEELSKIAEEVRISKRKEELRARCSHMSVVFAMANSWDVVVYPDYLSVDKTMQKFCIEGNNKELYGYKNESDEIIIPAMYSRLDSFSEGKCAAVSSESKIGFVSLYGDVFTPLLCGYINNNGETIVPFNFIQVSQFRYGRAFVKMIKPTNDIVPEWRDPSTNTLVRDVPIVEEQWQCINADGRTVFSIDCEEDKRCFPSQFSQGLCILRFVNKQGIICRLRICDSRGIILFENNNIEKYNLPLRGRRVPFMTRGPRFNKGIAVLDDRRGLCLNWDGTIQRYNIYGL